MTLLDYLKPISRDEINEAWKGGVVNNDNVLAISLTPLSKEEIGIVDYGTFGVVQDHIEGVDSTFTATTTEKVYIRSGSSTTKTGTQRLFSITGDRKIGDAFQDFALSNDVKYGTGDDVVVRYLYFNRNNGLGETGMCSIIVNSDGSGNAEDTASISIELRKTGATPEACNIKNLNISGWGRD